MSQRTDNILGCLFLASAISFFGLLYYAMEAYPRIESVEASEKTVKITMRLGSLCDAPDLLVKKFTDANPLVRIDNIRIFKDWRGRGLEIQASKKDAK